MQTEQKVTSRDLSEKLEEAGIPQKSLLYWWTDGEHWTLAGEGTQDDDENWSRVCSAFDVPELLEALPSFIDEEDSACHYELEIKKVNKNLFYVHYWDDVSVMKLFDVADERLVEALGETLYWAKVNGHVGEGGVKNEDNS